MTSVPYLARTKQETRLVQPLRVVFNPFYKPIKSLILGKNVCLKIKIFKCLVSKLTNISNCHPFDVVGRGSETQLQMGENLNR